LANFWSNQGLGAEPLAFRLINVLCSSDCRLLKYPEINLISSSSSNSSSMDVGIVWSWRACRCVECTRNVRLIITVGNTIGLRAYSVAAWIHSASTNYCGFSTPYHISQVRYSTHTPPQCQNPCVPKKFRFLVWVTYVYAASPSTIGRTSDLETAGTVEN